VQVRPDYPWFHVPVELGLKNRRALVTAASKGIGRACAAALAGEGARVYISSRDPKSIETTGREIGAVGWYSADVSHPDEPEALVNAAIDVLGGLDALVVNSGGPPASTFQTTPLEGWGKAFDLLLMSAVRLIRTALPHLKASDQGRIVIITSVAVRQPIPNLVLSNSLRAAVTGLAKTLSSELAPDRITVNCIAPDNIRTDALLRLGGDLGRMEAGAPMKRLAEPEEVGATCAFLCSRHAGYITGQTVGIDGGSVLGVH
jgi:3-oxoacyl-[acyl-carrier protein] reductase